MEHAREITPHLLQYCKRVPVRVAVVDTDGQTRRTRHIELCAEKFTLHGALRRILLPIVVKTDLSDSDNLRMLCPREELRTLRIRQHTRALGVHTDGGVEHGILLRIRHHPRGRRHRVPHADDLRDPRLGGACNHLRTVIIVAFVIQMRVRINECRHFSVSMRGKSCCAVPTT